VTDIGFWNIARSSPERVAVLADDEPRSPTVRYSTNSLGAAARLDAAEAAFGLVARWRETTLGRWCEPSPDHVNDHRG
jgi:hypothetical protein